MSAEAGWLCGVPHGERSPERVDIRNGYRERAWGTRVGTIELQIPKLRQGSYFPDWLLQPRRRAEQALRSVIALLVRSPKLDHPLELLARLDELEGKERPLRRFAAVFLFFSRLGPASGRAGVNPTSERRADPDRLRCAKGDEWIRRLRELLGRPVEAVVGRLPPKGGRIPDGQLSGGVMSCNLVRAPGDRCRKRSPLTRSRIRVEQPNGTVQDQGSELALALSIAARIAEGPCKRPANCGTRDVRQGPRAVLGSPPSAVSTAGLRRVRVKRR
jgi:hypothetical protein